ncbi:MAG TPA: chorismate-binding protein, partial [Campylobacterales bacterium]|nr:chorismate-binding protein [Campylobacterales bacterium]
KVDKFRYPLMIEANGQKLIQTVSEISADLPPEFMLGDAIFALLPAGSITGTPKKKCVETLKSIEGYDRGFFCGVFGYFDGSSMQSAVSIRYIEKTEEGYVYKSGGGITYDSDANAEYAEMLQKVYLAF